jgi:hypothetical protein
MQVFIHFVHILGFFILKKIYCHKQHFFNCQIQINQNGATSFKALKHPLKKSTVIHYKFLSLVKYLSIKLLLFKKKINIDLDILSYSQNTVL